MKFGPYRLKRQDRRVEGPDGPVELSTRAFDLLCVLLDRPGEVVSKEAIFEAIWPDVVVEENTLQVHVSALRKALDPSFIATIHGRGYKYAGPPPEMDGAEATAAPPQLKPVIVVLPFDNLGGNPQQQYFSDGITQDIIDRLTRFRMLSVIGHDSAFRFRNETPDFDAIRQSLGAGFLVSGNIRRSDSRIRIAVRLTDAESRKAIWAEHYDRPLADLFDVQDDVADLVAAAVAKHLEIEITGRTTSQHPSSLSAYEQVLLGHWHFNKQSKDGNGEAIRCYGRAVSADPGNGEMLGWLAQALMDRYFLYFDDDSLRTGIGKANEAVLRDPSSARCRMILGYGQIWSGGLDLARASIDQAVSLNPGDSYGYATRALVSIYEGRMKETDGWLERSLKLNPIPPPWFPEYAALIAFQDERYASAFVGFEALPDYAWHSMYALASSGFLGRKDKSSAIIARFAAQGQTCDIIAAAAREPYRDQANCDRLRAGLELALTNG